MTGCLCARARRSHTRATARPFSLISSHQHLKLQRQPCAARLDAVGGDERILIWAVHNSPSVYQTGTAQQGPAAVPGCQRGGLPVFGSGLGGEEGVDRTASETAAIDGAGRGVVLLRVAVWRESHGGGVCGEGGSSAAGPAFLQLRANNPLPILRSTVGVYVGRSLLVPPARE